MGGSRYRLDDLRRCAGALLAAAGVAPVRASELAAHLLSHDAAGQPAFGIATLAAWLGRIEERAVDPAAEGRVVSEMTGTALFDGQNGIPPLLLARAGELAMEKAREVGIGLTRVLHLGPASPVGAIAAELAIEPYLGMVVGHDGTWAVALPSGDGLPAVFDSALGQTAHAPLPDRLIPWSSAAVPAGGWLVQAVAVAALEPLATFHERLAEWVRAHPEPASALLPARWEANRRHAREHGVHVPDEVWKSLGGWIGRYDVAVPPPLPADGANS